MAAERIQPALSSIGQGLGGAQVLNPTDPRRPNVPNQAVEDFKKRTAEANKPAEVDLEKLKKMQESREGIYNINNEYKDALIEDEYYKRTVEGGEDPNKVINDITTELQRVNKTETELIKPFIKEATTVGENGERVMIYDDEGTWIPPDEALTFLTSSLQDSPEAQEAKQKGVYNQWLQSNIADLRKRSLKYDPSFSLGKEMLSEFSKFSTLPGVSEQTDVSAAFEELNEGANLSTVFESRPDLRDAFMDYLGSRTDIVPKWASNYAVTTGMSPYTLKSGEGEFMGLAMDAMMEEAENVFLPAPQRTKRLSVSQKRASSDSGLGDGTGGAGGFDLTTVTVVEPQKGGKGPKAIDYKMWGAGDETIDGTKVSGVVLKDGKLLPKTVDFGVTDDESLAINYINKKNAAFSEGEKVSQEEVINQLKGTQAQERGFDEETFTSIDKAIDNFGGFGDNEEGLYDRLTKQFGYDFATDEALADFREIIDDINFDNADDRKKAIKWLKENLPAVATRAKQQETTTPSKPKFN